MKVSFVMFVAALVVFTSVELSFATGNRFKSISTFQEHGRSYLRVEYDYTGVFGTIRLHRAVQPNGTFMPMAPTEIVDIIYESGRIVWILDVENMGRQRTFKVVVTT